MTRRASGPGRHISDAAYDNKSQTWDSKPNPGRNPQEREGTLAKLKTKGRLTTKELATYGIAEKPDEPKANGQQEETLGSGAVVSEPTRLFSES
jgi:hypothetical protein